MAMAKAKEDGIKATERAKEAGIKATEKAKAKRVALEKLAE